MIVLCSPVLILLSKLTGVCVHWAWTSITSRGLIVRDHLSLLCNLKLYAYIYLFVTHDVFQQSEKYVYVMLEYMYLHEHLYFRADPVSDIIANVCNNAYINLISFESRGT